MKDRRAVIQWAVAACMVVGTATSCAHRPEPNFSRAEFFWGQAQAAGGGRFAPDRMLEAEKLLQNAKDLHSKSNKSEAAKDLLRAESLLIEAERLGRQMGEREAAMEPPPRPRPVGTAPPPPMRLDADRQLALYRVKRGDTLWDISARRDIYGNPWRWSRLYEANRHALRSPHRIAPGQKLVVPRTMAAVPPAPPLKSAPEISPPTQDESKK